MNSTKKQKIQRGAALVLFLSLALSAVYCIVRLVLTPEGGAMRTRSDYVLMLIQCMLGLAVMALPSLLARRWKLMLPTAMHVMYYAFLYCAVFLGEVFSFYYLIPHWDTILHFSSGAMLAALGFILIDFLNRDEHVRLSLSPFFTSLFAFSFALAMGGVWEIYEYVVDGLMGLNMQKFIMADGTVLVGRMALTDTMEDIIVDAAAALSVALVAYMTNPARRNRAGAKRNH